MGERAPRAGPQRSAQTGPDSSRRAAAALGGLNTAIGNRAMGRLLKDSAPAARGSRALALRSALRQGATSRHLARDLKKRHYVWKGNSTST